MEVADLEDATLAFGPVPSRRLGKSLGMNNVPAKIVGEVSKDYQELWTSYKNLYAELALRYPKKLEIVKRNQAQLSISDLKGQQ